MARELYIAESESEAEIYAPLILPEVLPLLKQTNTFLIAAIEDFKAVGAAVMTLSESGAWLESIAVIPEYRRRGVGDALICQCVRALWRTGMQNLSAVLSGVPGDVGLFLEYCGLTPIGAEKSCFFSASLAALAEQPLLHSNTYDKKIMSMDEIPSFYLRSFWRKRFPQELSKDLIEGFDLRISQAMIKDKQIVACLLVRPSERQLSLEWAENYSGDKWVLLYMLRRALGQAEKLYAPETQVHFTCYDNALVQLSKKLMGNAAQTLSTQCYSLEGIDFRLKNTHSKWEEEL